MLADAKRNLAGSQAHDLWAYGDRAFNEQAEVLANARGRHAGPERPWRQAAAQPSPARRRSFARRSAMPALATEDFARWIKAEAPRRTGPSGVGKDNYDWYLEHVLLSPYDFDQQQSLLQRELDRSLASLRLEEVRNRAAPPIAEINDPAAYRRMARGAHQEQLYRLLVDAGFIADQPYYRAALAGQTRRLHAARRAQFLHPCHRARSAAAVEPPDSTGSSLPGCGTNRTPARSATRLRCSTFSTTGPKASPPRWKKS